MSSLVIDGVTEQDGVMVIWAQTASWLVPFPGAVPWLARCMVFTAGRPVANVPADSCPVLVRVGVGRISVMGRQAVLAVAGYGWSGLSARTGCCLW